MFGFYTQCNFHHLRWLVVIFTLEDRKEPLNIMHKKNVFNQFSCYAKLSLPSYIFLCEINPFALTERKLVGIDFAERLLQIFAILCCHVAHYKAIREGALPNNRLILICMLGDKWNWFGPLFVSSGGNLKRSLFAVHQLAWWNFLLITTTMVEFVHFPRGLSIITDYWHSWPKTRHVQQRFFSTTNIFLVL